MKTPKHVLVSLFSLALSCGFMQAQSASAGPRPTVGAGGNPSVAATVIRYGEKDVARVRTKLRFTTLIMLPRNEQILDFTCGDKEFWIVNGSQNFAYVKPAKASSRTNLNLVTASGNVYSFLLEDVSDQAGAEPDLKVFIEPKDDSMISALNSAPKWVPAQQVDDYRQQVELAKDDARQARKAAQDSVQREEAKFKSEYPTSLKFPYRFEANRKPFQVTAIYHDDKFTYIQANPQETPALYELKDGKPNLINFQFRQGAYVVDKILDNGYLSIGKQRLSFERQE
ncbi:MAG: TrbG/VirB9 family P-type conjugative transfer protein [Acidobacteriaceae bacterium]|nr:TrbG/VirB9 family P-type conjugative transfer protein [Acidobacteriaceae bacterium]